MRFKDQVVVGEDNKKGDILLKKGRKITSSDIGLLSSNGISEIEVYKTFNVSIISTGDEIVTVNSIKEDGQIYDINSYTLLAECKKSLFNVKNRYLIKDEKDKLKDAIIDSMSKSDVVVISGGSSKGKKDNTATPMVVVILFQAQTAMLLVSVHLVPIYSGFTSSLT